MKNPILNLKEEKEKGYQSGAFALAFAAILVKVCGMLYKVPLSYILGDEGMGYFNSAYTVYSFFFILCSAGVPKAITMLITKTKSEEGGSEYKIFKIALSLFFKIGLTATVLFLFLAEPLSYAIGNSKAFFTMIFISPSIVLVCISGVMRGYLNGYFDLVSVAISQLIEALGKLVIGLVFAYLAFRLGFTLPLISAFATLGISIGSFISVVYLYTRSKNANLRENAGQKEFINKKEIYKNIAKIALPISLSSALLNLSGIIDLGLIMHGLKNVGYSENEASALFGNYTTLAVPMLNLVISVITPITVAVFPKLAECHIKGKDSDFSEHLNTSTLLVTVIGTPCFMTFLLYSESTLDILYSSEAAKIGAPMLVFLSPAVILLSLLTLYNTALEAQGRIKTSVLSLIIGAAVKSISGYLLIGRGNIGILGAPLGTVLSYAISLIFSAAFLFDTKIKISVYKSLFTPIILSALSFSLPLLAVHFLNLQRNTLVDCILLFTSFFAYAIGVLLANKKFKYVIKCIILNKKSRTKSQKV